MGDGTKENPYTREDVLRLIEENGGKAEGLDLSGKVFKKGVDLGRLDLSGINIKGSTLLLAELIGTDLIAANLQEANLVQTKLYGANLANANLQNAELSTSNLEEANLSGANMQGANLEMTNLQGARLWEVDLRNATLWDANLVGAMLEDVKWDPKYVVIYEKEGNLHHAEQVYRNLKRRLAEQGMYDIAGEFFYREMEAKRKAQSWKEKPLSKLWSWVIRLLCGYGERYGNVVVAALVIIFGLAVVYVYSGLNVAYAIYFSAVSFTALGYGSWVNITPEGWVQALGAVESFIGVFTIALFLITFVRKMTR